MREFTGDFKFVCDAYIYRRDGSKLIEKRGKVFHRDAELNDGRWVPGDTYFLMDNGEHRRCAAKQYQLCRGYMWMPFSNVHMAKNVFVMHDRLINRMLRGDL